METQPETQMAGDLPLPNLHEEISEEDDIGAVKSKLLHFEETQNISLGTFRKALDILADDHIEEVDSSYQFVGKLYTALNQLEKEREDETAEIRIEFDTREASSDEVRRDVRKALEEKAEQHKSRDEMNGHGPAGPTKREFLNHLARNVEVTE